MEDHENDRQVLGYVFHENSQGITVIFAARNKKSYSPQTTSDYY